MILHVTAESSWRAAEQSGAYRGDSLETEGFIHCCLPRQLHHVLTSYFRGRSGLVLLEIDEARLQAELKWEGEPDRFPHVYGPVNVDAVTAVSTLPSQQE